MADLSDVDSTPQTAPYEFIDPSLLTSSSQPSPYTGPGADPHCAPSFAASSPSTPLSLGSLFGQRQMSVPEVDVTFVGRCIIPSIDEHIAATPPHLRRERQCPAPSKSIIENAPLLQWFEEHREWPYPTNDERLQLAKASGKTPEQTRIWFNNRRSRMKISKVPKTQMGMTPPNMVTGECWLGQDFSAPSSSNINSSSVNGDEQERTGPNFTSGHLSLETNFASKSQALQCNARGPAILHLPQQIRQEGDIQGARLLPPPGLALLDGRRNTGRKGKRRINAASLTGSRAPSQSTSPSKPFPCTFPLLCGMSFKDKHEWKRHEATHMPEMWICMPDGAPPVIDDHCAFCGLYDPNWTHFNTHHGISECFNGDLIARSFARKDQLRNHINRKHLRGTSDIGSTLLKPRNSFGTDLLDTWYRPPSDLAVQYPAALWCGFCQTTFPIWVERINHVGAHFQQGENLSTWTHLN